MSTDVNQVVGSLPGTLDTNSMYAVRVGNGYDLYFTTVGATAINLNAEIDVEAIKAYIADRHVLQATPVFTTTSNAPQDVINSSVTVDGGTYKITVSYMFNVDTNAADFESYCTVNGVELVTADAQDFLGKLEAKDNTAGGSIVTGTGSGQRLTFHKHFENVSLPAGTIPVVFQISSEDNASEASCWNVDITIERTVL